LFIFLLFASGCYENRASHPKTRQMQGYMQVTKEIPAKQRQGKLDVFLHNVRLSFYDFAKKTKV